MNQAIAPFARAAGPATSPELPLAGGAASGDGALCDALLDSRQRWRDLVTMAADFVFETDAWGRLVFVAPDPAIGWPVGTLLGQPAELLLADADGGATFNPFRITVPVRRRRAWLRRPNRALNGEMPVRLLDTDLGVRQVDDVLGRLEYGLAG